MPRPRTLLALLGGLATFAGGLATADAAPPPVVQLLTDGPAVGTDPDEVAEFGAASTDGQVLIFITSESLVATDTDSRDDVYRRNADGSYVNLTEDPTGPDAEESVDFKRATADGSRVIFSTEESLDADDTDSSADLYRRNADGTLDLLTDDPTGPDEEAAMAFEGASADLSRVSFRTSSTLATSDTDTFDDIYTRDSDGGLTHVSDNLFAADGNVGIGFGRVTADGTRVIFGTDEKLLATDDDSSLDVYVKESNGSLSLVSADPTGPDGPEPASFLDVSAQGNRVFFTTDESLAATDTDTAGDVYRRDEDGTLVHVSDSDSTDASVGAGLAGISTDGTGAVFTTTESMDAADGDSENDLYRRNADGSVDFLTDDPSGPDAELAADLQQLSSDGSRVIFRTNESLATTDTDTAADMYRRNADGSLTHLTDNPTGPDAEEDANSVRESADGSRVFFTVQEAMSPLDTDANTDVYAREADGSVTPMTDNPAGADIEDGASLEAISADGSRLIYGTVERQAASDTDEESDLYAAITLPPAGPGGGGPTGGGGPAGGGGPGGGGGARDVLAPTLSGVSAGASTFRLGSLLPQLSRTAPTGTTLRFTLSEPSRVTLTFSAALAGRRVGRTCRRPTKANRKRPRCTRLVTKGSLTVSGRRGANRLRFQGRLSARRRLTPGRYRIVLRAIDAAGNRSRTRTVVITILPARK